MPYFVDGNNLIGLSAARARDNAATRRAFLSLLSRYASSRGGRLTVFFDGDDPDRAVPPRGVQVRFSAPLSSDDAILRGIAGARAAAEITVVTNDRSLGSRCRSLGAQVMDWREFTRRMERCAAALAREQKEETVDVDEWSEYFGLDPGSDP
jgi:predicted RNA-binding protein with PIN domain